MRSRLKELRKKFSYSKIEISQYLNISINLYSSYESGKKDIPVSILSYLAKKYNTSIDYIIYDTDVIEPHTKIISNN